MSVDLERADIQGLFARGYANLSLATFVLLGFEQGASARSWLGDALDGITTSEDRPERRALNVAFTASGLGRLGVDGETVGRFSTEFVSGMTAPHRRRILADEGTSAPEHWDWGGPGTTPVDGVLLLYAADRAELTAFEEEQTALLRRHGVRELHRLGTSDLDGFEPFGWRDGVSQPLVEGLGKSGPENLTVKAGEFVLGYSNEYGPTHRPPPARAQRQLSRLPPAGTGRPGVLALPRRRHADRRRCGGPRGPPPPGLEVRRPLAERRAAGARARR